MAQRFEMNVEPRQTGKSFSRELRTQRKVPAVVYGSVKNKNIFIEENTVRRFNVSQFDNALFNLKSTDPELNNVVVLMKSVDIHPLSRIPVHVDLFALDLKKAVRVFVEVKLTGKPAGLAEGGLLNVVNRTVEIECLPADIPEAFTADISNLGVGDALHLSDVQIPKNIKLISNPQTTIAVVNLFEEESLTTSATPTAEAAGAATPAAGAAAPAAGAAAGATAAKPEAKKEDKK